MDRPTCPEHPHVGPMGCYGCLVCEGERLATADKQRTRRKRPIGAKEDKYGDDKARTRNPWNPRADKNFFNPASTWERVADLGGARTLGDLL